MILTAPYATGNMAMVLITAVHLIPVLLLVLFLWGRPAGQTGMPSLAAARNGWLAPQPGEQIGQQTYYVPRIHIHRSLTYG